MGLLNRPFDPANRILPAIYFSDHWRWEPDSVLKPRRECWGGLLFALGGAWLWAGWARRDALARNLALWGVLGGALGFPLGQSLQAFHAWNPDLFKTDIWTQFDPVMNWWNWMETTFGAVMGACLGLGLWLNRRHIGTLGDATAVTIAPAVECSLLVLHVTLLALEEFTSLRAAAALYDLGLMMAVIPMMAVAGGHWSPFLLALPITALPIAGKTLNRLVYQEHALGPIWGWLLYLAVPLVVTTAAALWSARQAGHGLSGHEFTRRALLLATWLYFGLNFTFFHFPWPWNTWTSRTPNALAYTVCALGLTLACMMVGRRRRGSSNQ